MRRALFTVFFFLFAAIVVFGASGDVDPSFNASLVRAYNNGSVAQSVIQPDGKIIIAGDFSMVSGRERINLARVNTDGTLDTTFNPPLVVAPGPGLAINSLVLQSDGKIVIAGQFAQLGTTVQRGIARLNPDGSPDVAFNNNSSISSLSYVVDLKMFSDDKLVFTGVTTGGLAYPLTILNADGSQNATIDQQGIVKIAVQPNGNILAVTSLATIRRYNHDLTVDGSFAEVNFTAGTKISDIAFQSDGKILLGGGFVQINGTNAYGLARLSSSGSLDTSFNAGNSGPNGTVTKIIPRPDDSIVIGGTFNNYNSTQKYKIAYLNSNGTLNSSFNNIRPYAGLSDLDIQADGKIVVSSGPNNSSTRQLERLNPDGTADVSFQTVIGVYGLGYRLLVQPDDRILVAGAFTHANPTASSYVARLLVDGASDPQVVSGGDEIHALAIQPDNKIIMGETYFSLPPKRVNSDGSSDIQFASAFGFNDVALQANGKVLFAGRGNSSFNRCNANGSADATLSTTVDSEVRRIIYLPDTKILIGGTFSTVNGVPRSGFARLFADGSVDQSFVPPTGTSINLNDMVLQPDGKILFGGDLYGLNGPSSHSYLARLNSNGSLDASYSPTLDAPVFAIKIQPDNNVLIGGSFSSINGTPRIRIARLKADGSTDLSFAPNLGANATVHDIELQSNGKIIVAGEFNRFNGVSAVGIVRLLNASAPIHTAFDFDADGKADIAVFRPWTNRWYHYLSSTSAVTEATFGSAGDIPAPADYDGDGKTDDAIFRPSTGDWWYLSSINNAQINIHFGASGDIPLPSDFDGDGKADLVVYRPSNNVWYRFGSTGVTSILAFGAPGDKPLIGDFDGDGKSDPAIFRPSTGDWWYAASSAGGQFRAVHWGAAGDVAVPADYDGDGTTDLAVFRPSNGAWYILNSSNGSFTIQSFGLSGDKPVAADYDGDGKADIAVFRPSTGVWYMLRSTAGFSAFQFGVSTDTAVPNAFIQ